MLNIFTELHVDIAAVQYHIHVWIPAVVQSWYI